MRIFTTASLQEHSRIRRYREKNGDGLCFKFNTGRQFLCIKTQKLSPCFFYSNIQRLLTRFIECKKKGNLRIDH